MKLSHEVYEKAIEEITTKTEMKLLLYLISIGGPLSSIENIYYQDILKELDITKQTFYNTVELLVKKEFITADNVTTGGNGYWSFLIRDNAMMNSEDFKKGYINLNREFLYNEDFKALKLNEMKICLKILFKIGSKASTTSENIASLAMFLGIKSIYVVRGYIEKIKKIFPFRTSSKRIKESKTLKKRTYIFLPNKKHSNKKYKREEEGYLTQTIKGYCSSRGIGTDSELVLNAVALIYQYKNRVSIRRALNAVKVMIDEKQGIEPKYINVKLNRMAPMN